MDIYDRSLDIYFRQILETAAFLPPQLAYKILHSTGHLFRNFDDYSCGYEKGAFLKAYKNLENVNITPSSLPYNRIKEVLKEYLRFETRFAMENIWVRRENSKYIIQSFNRKYINSLLKLVSKQNYVIVSAHFSGIIDMVALLNVIGHQSTFIASNAMNQPWDLATPMQRSVATLFRSWIKRQPLIFSDEKDIMERSCQTLLSNKSVIMAADVPGYKGSKVSMFGKNIWVPAGSAIMASKCNVPILVAIPWALKPYEPYKIFIRVVPPSHNYDSVMQKIFDYIETVVRLNPAGWNGWLYFHRMLST
ncbi:MAG: hypothetical protein HQK72_00435 [Desulfamplus sp.]|nr:hypothetical protein [Desulfamplus sp.]